MISNSINVLHIVDVQLFAGSKSQLIDYFRGHIVSWEKVEGSIWQFYDN